MQKIYQTYIPSSCKVLLKIFNDSTTSRLILLVFVPERCGTHDLNFNKEDMLHKKKIDGTILNYFEHFLVELRKLYDFDG